MSTFADYAEVYSSLYQDKDYQSEASYVSGLSQRYSAGPVVSVIEFGAGSGQLANELALLGHTVRACDLSPEMAEKATGLVPVEVADIRTFRATERFDCAVAFFHVLSYLTTEADLDSAFQSVAGVLRPGGVFIADFWFDQAVSAQKPEVRVKRVQSSKWEIVRIAEPAWDRERKIVTVNYTIFAKTHEEEHFRIIEESHKLRYFGTEELGAVASRHGMTLQVAEETLTGAPLDKTTWGSTAVFAKKG